MTYPISVSASLLALTLVATSFVPTGDQLAQAISVLQVVV